MDQSVYTLISRNNAHAFLVSLFHKQAVTINHFDRCRLYT